MAKTMAEKLAESISAPAREAAPKSKAVRPADAHGLPEETVKEIMGCRDLRMKGMIEVGRFLILPVIALLVFAAMYKESMLLPGVLLIAGACSLFFGFVRMTETVPKWFVPKWNKKREEWMRIYDAMLSGALEPDFWISRKSMLVDEECFFIDRKRDVLFIGDKEYKLSDLCRIQTQCENGAFANVILYTHLYTIRNIDKPLVKLRLRGADAMQQEHERIVLFLGWR